MKNLLFIVNPKAGRGAIRGDLFDIIMIFSEAGYEVAIYFTKGPEDAERKVIADGAKYDLIVCAGGDGTLDNTVCGYVNMGEKKVPLGYIPVGTTNDFARSLRISRKPIEAAQQIVNGKKTKIDVGRFGTKSFIYIAAFGIFTDISYSTNQALKKAIGHSAYILEAIKNIGSYKGFTLSAQFDDMLISGKYLYGMITNTLSVGGFKLRGAKHVILDDGKFDCLFIRMPQGPADLQKILAGLLQNDIDGNEMFFECKASKVVVESVDGIPWTLDGEYGGNTNRVEILNQKQGVTLVLPEVPMEEIAHQQNEESAVAQEELVFMDMADEIDIEEIYKELSEKYKDVWM